MGHQLPAGAKATLALAPTIAPFVEPVPRAEQNPTKPFSQTLGILQCIPRHHRMARKVQMYNWR